MSLETAAAEGAVNVLPGKSTTVMRRGDRLRTRWCGGGGHGPPLEREPERVLRDVVEEKITPAHARETYGVVVDATGRTVDRRATRALRAAKARPAGAGRTAPGTETSPRTATVPASG